MRNAILILLCLTCLFGGWMVWMREWFNSIAPAGTTLSEHLGQRSPPEDARVFVVDGEVFLALAGQMESYPRFPSGPPVYVFNRERLLVDWTPDQGDDGKFTKRWPGIFAGRKVTPDEISSWPGAVK